jgi:predicted DNA-binding protein YlxM (UPF0122 family)
MIDKATLLRLYIDEHRSIRSIAALLRVAPRTVHDAMIRGRIPRRQRWEQHATTTERAARGQLDEAILRRLYVIEELSIREIAERFDTCTATVHHALVAWNIPRRKRGRREKSSQRLVSREDYGVGEQASVSFVEHAIEML